MMIILLSIPQTLGASPLTKRLKIAYARILVSHIATRDLPIYGSEVGLRVNVDSSAVSHWGLRVGNNPDLITAARIILALHESETNHHRNNDNPLQLTSTLRTLWFLSDAEKVLWKGYKND